MIRFETPTLILTVPETLDLTLVQTAYCTISQGSFELTASGEAVQIPSAHRAEVYLSQAQSGKFRPGPADVQLNLLYADGTRLATEIATMTVGKNLLPRVLP